MSQGGQSQSGGFGQNQSPASPGKGGQASQQGRGFMGGQMAGPENNYGVRQDQLGSTFGQQSQPMDGMGFGRGNGDMGAMMSGQMMNQGASGLPDYAQSITQPAQYRGMLQQPQQNMGQPGKGGQGRQDMGAMMSGQMAQAPSQMGLEQQMMNQRMGTFGSSGNLRGRFGGRGFG
jgi:hypothetical protein